MLGFGIGGGAFTFFLGGGGGGGGAAVVEVPPRFGTASARWVRRRHIDPLARQRRSGRSLRRIDSMVESLEEDART